MSPPARTTRNRSSSSSNGPSSIKLPPSTLTQSAPGPASTPRIDHHPPPFTVDQLASLLDQQEQRDGQLLRPSASRRPSSSLSQCHDSQYNSSDDDYDDDDEHEHEHVKEEVNRVDGRRHEMEVVVVNHEMLYWGIGLVTTCTSCFIWGVWAMAIAPFVDSYNSRIINAMAKDTHYKYLFVFLVPVTLYAVIINWWGLKIFRHA